MLVDAQGGSEDVAKKKSSKMAVGKPSAAERAAEVSKEASENAAKITAEGNVESAKITGRSTVVRAVIGGVFMLVVALLGLAATFWPKSLPPNNEPKVNIEGSEQTNSPTVIGDGNTISIGVSPEEVSEAEHPLSIELHTPKPLKLQEELVQPLVQHLADGKPLEEFKQEIGIHEWKRLVVDLADSSRNGIVIETFPVKKKDVVFHVEVQFIGWKDELTNIDAGAEIDVDAYLFDIRDMGVPTQLKVEFTDCRRL